MKGGGWTRALGNSSFESSQVYCSIHRSDENLTKMKKPLLISLLLVAAANIALISIQGYVSLDQFFFIAVIAMAVIGKAKDFIWEWLPFVTLFLFYRYLRGLAPVINPDVNIFPMIQADLALFGSLPTVTLQHWFYVEGSLQWYDWVATLLYISHYLVSFFVLFIFWLTNTTNFKKYSIALMVLSYASFLTYLLYPAMPPWMASEQGHIPQVTKIMVNVFAAFPVSVNFFNVSALFGANLVAAVPSLHAAYPVLLWLFLRKIKLANVLSFIYMLAVWVTIVYLGEHYVIDVILGAIYAAGSYVLVINQGLHSKIIDFYKQLLSRAKKLKISF